MSNRPQQRQLGHLSKGQRRDNMARKREERAARAAHKKQRQAQQFQGDDENFAAFAAQLVKMGLELRDIPGDGNCLFRALGDQLEGHGRNHLKHRRDVVKFMLDHRADFEPFVEDDVPFERHTKNLNDIGTYAGNDAIVAFARLHQLNVVIHQVNSPCWQIHGSDDKGAKQLHISYHNGDHYSSIRKLGDHGESPANIKMAIGDQIDANGTSEDINKTKPKNNHKETWNGDSDNYYSVLCNNDMYSADYSEDTLQNLHLPEVCGPEAGMAKAVRTEDSTVEAVMRMSGCEDEDLVRQTLENVGYDMESAMEIMIEIMSTSYQAPSSSHPSSTCALWDENGTGTRIFGNDNSGAKPKLKQQSTSQRQRSKKLEKKARASERRRQERLGNSVQNGGGSSDEDYHVVADQMGTLKI